VPGVVIGFLTSVGAVLGPALLASWLLGSAIWAALVVFAWPAVRDSYGRDAVRYAVALVLIWPVVYAFIAVMRAFGRLPED
jgi:hypothetical protein